MPGAVTGLVTFGTSAGPLRTGDLDSNYTALATALNTYATFGSFVADSSVTPNTITLTTPNPGISIFSYTLGVPLSIKVANTNTSTTVNVNVNGLGNVRVKNSNGSDPAIGQLVANGTYQVVYDGTNFVLAGSTAITGFATPTGVATLTATAGTLATAIRSDANIAIDQTIAPTWTGIHTWQPATTTTFSQVLNGLTNGYAATALQQNSTPKAFYGVEGSTPFITGAASGDFSIRTQGGTVRISVNSGASAAFAINGGLTFIADSAGTLFNAGYLDTPINTQNLPYTCVASDRGKIINCASTGTLTLPSGVFGGGATIGIRCPNTVTVTVTLSGGTLQWAIGGGTTGNRTLTGEGIATVLYLSGSVASITGTPLS